MKSKKLTSTQYVAVGFLLLIVAGSILLSLPVASAAGEKTTYIDALFTATTSVCVTGLVTVTTATHWSLFGKVVILILIQFGGLGIVSCLTIGMLVVGKKIGITGRKFIREAYSFENIAGVVTMMKRIVIGTFLAEALGAFCYSFIFIPEFGVWRGLGQSIFTSISAFCNAGIDILGDNSLEFYKINPMINITTMCLIISGGIGFVVWWDLKKTFLKIRSKGLSWTRFWTYLELHSKLVLLMTGILILGGAIVFFLTEYSNPDTFGNLSFGGKIMAAFFQSVTTRTAGFATVDQGALSDFSASFALILMFIGGSPLGTAGGVKTTTILLLIFLMKAYLKNEEHVEAFDREVPSDNLKTAMVILFAALGASILAINLMTLVTDFSYLDIAYETISALATVGLTRGITQNLPLLAKVFMIICMYIGRIGPVTLMMAIAAKKSRPGNIRKVKKRVYLG
ncbi:MAG TPA: potassium transporter TrkG [Lachnospiraceae bacterium]